MDIIFNKLNNNFDIINEGTESTFGKRDGLFTSYDKYIGPDGTVYDTKFIAAVVDDACSVLTEITQGTITPYLAELPILYTFDVPTMATNSRFIFINPGFVMQLLEWCGNSPAGVAFVIMHEVYHNLFLHKEREMEHPELFPDHRQANAAQDYEINWVIEHSFPDTRTEKQAQAEGESIYDENGNINQILGGVTKACHGLIDEKYANKTWEDIYPLLTSEDDEDDGEVDNSERQVSDDFKEGYADGWNDAIRALRAKGLVENVVTPAFVMNKFMLLLESAKDDYDAGYSEGYNKAMEIIMGIMSGGTSAGGSNGGGGGSPQMPNMPPIDGLQTMKPINPPKQDNADGSSNNDPNTPVEMPNVQSDASSKSNQQSNSNNSQKDPGSNKNQGGSKPTDPTGGDGGYGAPINRGGSGGSGSSQGGQSNSQQTSKNSDDNTNDSSQNIDILNIPGKFSDETSAAGVDGSKTGNRSIGNSIGKAGNSGPDGVEASDLGIRNTDGLTSKKQAIEDIMSNKKIVSVGVSNGKYSGKTSGIGNDHTMSEDAGNALAKQAGYEEPTDKEYAGRNKNPFTTENADALIETLKKMDSNARSVPGNTGGTGISSVIDRVTEVSTTVVDWRAELKRHLVGYFNKLTPAGWSKKKIARGMYNRFRDYEGESMKNLIIMIDTSGSVLWEGEYLNQIVTEFNTIAQQIRPKEIDLVLFCDGVYHHEILSKREIRDFYEVAKIKSGGTTYTDCFKYIEENYIDENKKFACCVIFTDMDLSSASLPDENTLSWNPGDPEIEGSGKLLWFVLNDSKDTYKLEVPYGTTIEVKQSDFVKSLKNNYKISESAGVSAVPRRSIMKKPKLYEGYFKNYGDLKAQAAQVAAQEVEDTATLSDSPEETTAPAPAPVKKRLDPVAMRKRQMAAMRASGAMNQTVDDIKSWFSKNTRISSWKIEVSSYDLSVVIKDTVEFVGKTLTSIPAYIVIEKIEGDLIVAGNPHLQYFPIALSCEVTGNFYCTNLPNLKSLEGMPYKIGGNVIVNRCPRLETLTGAPSSLDNFNGGFLSDGNFTEDDFYATIENGGIMPGEEYTGEYEDDEVVEESLSAKRPRSISKSKIVESRIALGKNFNKMNEAFESQILRNLANNPANRDALTAMRQMNILWSEIPNDMITVINNNVLKLRNLNKAPNNDETKFGLAICCDKDKRITCIFTGNKRGIWSNNTWKYVPQSTIDLINDRVDLCDLANAMWKPADEVERAKEECRRIGINPYKQSLRSRGRVRTKGDLSMEHLFFIPDLCRIAYLIKGIDDNDALNGGGYGRDFSYITQEKKREQMQANRKLANTGVVRNPRTRTVDQEITDDEGNTKTVSREIPYSNRNVERDPAFKKYMRLCITPEVFANINRAHASGLGLKKDIESMTASVKDNADKVRTAVKDVIDSGIVSGSAADALNLRFILAPAKKFNQHSASMISRIDEYLANETQPYLDRLILKHTDTEELNDIYDNIQTKRWDTYAPSGEYFNTYNSSIKDYYNASEWYKSYLGIAGVYAELLGAIAKAKRGNTEYLENYAQAVADATSSYSLGRFNDLEPSGRRTYW